MGGVWKAALAVAVVLLVTTGVGLYLRRRRGTFLAHSRDEPAPDATKRVLGTTEPALAATLTALGVTAGAPATLLQFSSAFCAPCRATRALCADVAARVPGVRHLDVDAESHLDAVRALGIWRTPTVLLIDAHGRVIRRATGAPTRARLLAALGAVLPSLDVGTS